MGPQTIASMIQLINQGAADLNFMFKAKHAFFCFYLFIFAVSLYTAQDNSIEGYIILQT